MPSRYYFGKTVTRKRVVASTAETFEEVVEQYLLHPIELPITKKDYNALKTKQEKLNAKDTGYLVACTYSVSPVDRSIENAEDSCNLLFIDLDSPEDGHCPAAPFLKNPQLLAKRLAPFSFAAYTTASSTAEKPRMRIMVEAEGISLEDYPQAVRSIAAKLRLDTDWPGAKESVVPNQPMFLPVVFADQDPDFQNPLVLAETRGQSFTADDIQSDTGIPVTTRTKTTTGSTEAPAEFDGLEFLRAPVEQATPDVVKKALDALDPDMSYLKWVEIGMALRHQFQTQPEEAFDLFNDWSAKGSKYESEEATRAKWDKDIKPSPKGRCPVTIRTLLKRSVEAGWDPEKLKTQCFDSTADWIQIVATNRHELMVHALQKIAGTPLLGTTEEEVLLSMIRTQLRTLLQISVPLAALRNDLKKLKEFREKSRRAEEGDDEIPEWAQGWCYVSKVNKFYHIETRKDMIPEALDAEYSRRLLPTAEQLEKQDKEVTEAELSRPTMLPRLYLLNTLKCESVYDFTYDPSTSEKIFTVKNSKRYVNTYRPFPLKSDAKNSARVGALIQEHISNLIIEPKNQRIMLDFMAHNIQFPGVKIRWAPVIIGVQGCGKTWIGEVLQCVIGPDNYKLVQDDDLTSGFNDWAFGHQIVVIEEIKVEGRSKHATMNKLKGPITNDRLPITQKMRDSRTAENVTNYLLFSNFPDALALTSDSRRYFVVKSRYQHKSQKPGPEYFVRMFEPLKQNPGAIKHFLENWQISDDFNPDGDAPTTQYLQEMIDDTADELTSTVRRLIAEADCTLIAQDMVASKIIEAQLLMEGVRFSHNALAAALKAEGYNKSNVRPMIGTERPYLWVRDGCLKDWTQNLGELARHRYETKTMFPEDTWL